MWPSDVGTELPIADRAADVVALKVWPMLDDVRIRDARPDEANFAAEMTRKMLVELEQYGGLAAAKSDSALLS